jgi:hypothetical protein
MAKSAVCMYVGMFYAQGLNTTRQVISPCRRAGLISVFNSNFFEGCNSVDGRATTVQKLHAHESFEVFYAILYYLYTDRIYFTTAPMKETTPRHQVPPCDAEEAYRVGDILGLSELKKTAMKFLVHTTDGANILDRIFGEFALKYQDIGKGYETVFYEFWPEIRKTDALVEYFKRVQAEEQDERINEVTMRCLDLMKGLTCHRGRRVAVD